MPALLTRLRQRSSRRVLIWAALSVLLGLAVLLSLSDLAGVPAQETMRANSQQQRVIIDPVTGTVSGLSVAGEEASPFEVAEEEPEAVPIQKPVAEEPVSDEPPVETTVPTEPTSAVDGGNYEPLTLDRADPPVPLVARSKESLVTAPAPEISEKIGDEQVPKAGAKDAKAATMYAKSFIRGEDQHLVSIVVTGVGFNGEVLNQVLAMPSVVTVGFSPYGDRAAQQIEALRNKGHEVWAMLPLMGARYPQDDPGPLGLINALTIKAAMARLHTIMADTVGSVGFILPSDENFSKHTDLWNPIRDEIDTRGLYFLSTHPTRNAKDLTSDETQREHIRRADLVLDTTTSAANIRSKLASIPDLAAKQTELIVLVTARPQALKLLDEWLATDALAGIATLAPLSAIYVPYQEPVEAPEPENGDHGGGAAKEGHGEPEAKEESTH